jgi:hypothetical protein
MPVRTQKIQGGGVVIDKRCEVCGSPDAPFGFGVHYFGALRQNAKGNLQRAKELLGKWYCGEHKVAWNG